VILFSTSHCQAVLSASINLSLFFTKNLSCSRICHRLQTKLALHKSIGSSSPKISRDNSFGKYPTMSTCEHWILCGLTFLFDIGRNENDLLMGEPRSEYCVKEPRTSHLALDEDGTETVNSGTGSELHFKIQQKTLT
jgi:hypothetical protein